jgi:hypothetical protein
VFSKFGFKNPYPAIYEIINPRHIITDAMEPVIPESDTGLTSLIYMGTRALSKN